MTPGRPHLAVTLTRLPVRTGAGAQEDAPGRLAAGYMGRLAAFGVAWLALIWAVADALLVRIPFQDAAAYWRAWHGPLYLPDLALDIPHFVYSPVAALAIWPLAQLSLPAFVILWAALGFAAYVWLLAPLPLGARLPALGAGLLFALNGNVEWLLALVVVVGMRWPSLWLVGLFTKVTPFLGFAWFVLRRDWRAVGITLGVAAVLVGLSALILPGSWPTWVRMVVGFGEPMGNPIAPMPPLWLRLAAAAVLVVWGAHTDRPGVLAGVLLLSTPDVQPWAFGFLAAVPRLQGGYQIPAESR